MISWIYKIDEINEINPIMHSQDMMLFELKTNESQIENNTWRCVQHFVMTLLLSINTNRSFIRLFLCSNLYFHIATDTCGNGLRSRVA